MSIIKVSHRHFSEAYSNLIRNTDEVHSFWGLVISGIGIEDVRIDGDDAYLYCPNLTYANFLHLFPEANHSIFEMVES